MALGVEGIDRIKHEVASDLVRQYLAVSPDNSDIMYAKGWRGAVVSCAVGMGVYDEFCRLLEEVE